MIYLTKPEVEYKIEDLPFIDELNFQKSEDNVYFTIDNVTYAFFPMEHKGLHKAIDQIIMTGHYLYGKNEEFRRAYLELYDNREFNINYRTVNDGRHLFTRDLFHLFLYGIIASSYLSTLPPKPVHYFARPIADEKNPSLEAFLKEEFQINKRYRKMDGTPFYNYIMKKSFIMPNNNIIGGDINICPVTDIIHDVKSVSENINKLATFIFKKMIDSNIQEDVQFCKTFIDSSWSPYLQAN